MNPFGNGIVTLLALALGLGSLNMAFQGLLNGAIDGASGTPSFVFATRPVKFVLLELFWIGLGLLLLLVAWRGVSRPRTGDKGDEDEDEPANVRGVVSRSAMPPSPLTAHDARLVPEQRPDDHRVMIVQPAGKALPGLPEPFRLYASRPYAVLAFVAMNAFAVSSGFTLLALERFLGLTAAAILFTPVVLVYLRIVHQCIQNFFRRGPVLVLDRFGVTNHRRHGHMIPWTEVDAVRLDASNSATYLVLRFPNASDMHKHFGTLRFLPSAMQRMFYKGFEGRVKLTSLSFKRGEVQQVAQAFLKYSKRR